MRSRDFRMGAYDQFAENQSKFGVHSEFDLTMYTTHVNSAEVPLQEYYRSITARELKQEAARMEREMKSSDGTTNVHLLEERGIVVDMDEEELYSKVHSSEHLPRRRGRPAPKEEKVLSRSIMMKVPEKKSFEKNEEERRNVDKEKRKKEEEERKKKEEAEKKSQCDEWNSYLELSASAPEFVLKYMIVMSNDEQKTSDTCYCSTSTDAWANGAWTNDATPTYAWTSSHAWTSSDAWTSGNADDDASSSQPSDSISFWSADCGTGVSVSHGCCPKYANAEPAVQQCYLSSSEPADTSNPYNKSNAVSVVLLFVVIRLTMDVERKIHIRKRRRRFDIRGFLISFP